MHTLTPTRTGPALLDALAPAWRALCDAADDLQRRWQQRQDRLSTQRSLDELSPQLLRDLGIDRSDIDSIATAAAHGGDPTRVRMTQLARRLSVLL
jgi:uncharacterized protein YjiS (DUF1127 family)